MNAVLPPIRMTGASVLVGDELVETCVSLQNGAIVDVGSEGSAGAEVDFSGYWVLPGIIDLHGDAFERHLAPRANAPFEVEMGLRSCDRDAAAHGVTTAWLAQSWSWEGGVRHPDYAERLMQGLADYRPRMLTDLRIQIRCETHTVPTKDRLLAAIERFGVDYVIFNNHLDEAAKAVETDPARQALWAKGAGLSIEDHRACIYEAKAQSSRVPAYLCALAEAFDAMGVRYGSHDDEDAETRERYSMIGAHICEFPTSQAAAAVAKAEDDPVLMGAPNVVRGGSQSGNIAATDLIRRNRCDALVSDYYYPALAGAAYRLADDGLMTFPAAWAMISTNPAGIMGLFDRGTIKAGKRADLVVVDPETRIIEATISGGRVTHLSGQAALRLSGAGTRLSLAAE